MTDGNGRLAMDGRWRRCPEAGGRRQRPGVDGGREGASAVSRRWMAAWAGGMGGGVGGRARGQQGTRGRRWGAAA
ncbi:hypothetical protein GUJ93_ZPchr0008g12428 [Zizania palustris]|uniref:Uncharacterized protein n=1 Tax=Zizania palustris TaxID=103762 RepID=A0A8J5RKL6_ZIZPA|nr:hypothetical protein GUJ93_ZPchr0008g12428 [Zizania palustris]